MRAPDETGFEAVTNNESVTLDDRLNAAYADYLVRGAFVDHDVDDPYGV